MTLHAKLLEVRRLTGPNVVLDRPGAVVDVSLAVDATSSVDPMNAAESARGDARRIAARWELQARRILDAVGWSGEITARRSFTGGISLALSAPIDALYAACDVNEWAWTAVEAVLCGDQAPNVDIAAERLRQAIATEANPRLIALRDATAARGRAFLWDTELATVGQGAGSLTWPVDSLPDPAAVDWSAVHDIPVALVTGTNGKSTTVRLAAAMAAAAGRTPGVASTDWVRAGDAVLDTGDYSGPGGARLALRDARVDLAILETARGGMLRRGLAVDRADVAAVTNLAEDHLGDFGVPDIEALADVKLVVARVARRLVLNADDPLLRTRGLALAGGTSVLGETSEADVPITWFSLDAHDPFVVAHVAAGESACVLTGDRLVAWELGAQVDLVAVGDIPIAWGGAARYNIANALAAVGVARGLGLPWEAIRSGLTTFENTPETNPGRLNVFEVGGVRVVVDYAHNPHGQRALNQVTAAMPAKRRLATLGQAGDRDDAALLDLARAVVEAMPDHIVVKELPSHLRGRAPGELPRFFDTALHDLGVPPDAISHASDDVDAARQALAWARPGDLVVLTVHAGRGEVVGLLEG
jgi:cyanophycin synthetase